MQFSATLIFILLLDYLAYICVIFIKLKSLCLLIAESQRKGYVLIVLTCIIHSLITIYFDQPWNHFLETVIHEVFSTAFLKRILKIILTSSIQKNKRN